MIKFDYTEIADNVTDDVLEVIVNDEDNLSADYWVDEAIEQRLDDIFEKYDYEIDSERLKKIEAKIRKEIDIDYIQDIINDNREYKKNPLGSLGISERDFL